MHGSVREELENLLAAKPAAAFAGHVSGCQECASELDVMRRQSQLFKTLQAPEPLEPRAGFYARVMQRIEESAKRSIWWVFVYSPAGKRLALASLLLSVALGSYVVAAENNDGHLTAQAMVTLQNSNEQSYIPVRGSADEQRAAVLENLVELRAPSE